MNSSKITKKFRKINNLPYLPSQPDIVDHQPSLQNPHLANMGSQATSQAHHP